MSDDQELPHAQLVRDWAEGKPLPPEVQAIKDWLQRTFSDADMSVPSVLDEVSEKAEAEGWHPDSVHAALLICRLAGIDNQFKNSPRSKVVCGKGTCGVRRISL